MTDNSRIAPAQQSRFGPILRYTALFFTGLMAGFFWSFSVAVMPGLTIANSAAAIVAMQGINLAVHDPLFGLGFFGALATAAAAALHSLVRRDGLAGWAAAIGGGVYILGVLGVTAGFNVPLNKMLAAVDPVGLGTAEFMAAYIADWSFWNNVRTLASLSAFVLLVASVGLSCYRR